MLVLGCSARHFRVHNHTIPALTCDRFASSTELKLEPYAGCNKASACSPCICKRVYLRLRPIQIGSRPQMEKRDKSILESIPRALRKDPAVSANTNSDIKACASPLC
eukprot:1157230-Pelagomonas_calceolata.AAC.2